MKSSLLLFKTGLVALLFVFAGLSASAATFTATSSGNWSSSATWGGSGLGATISSADNIVIGAGITVTLDENVTINNATASLAVAGTLSGSSGLTLTSGTISGAGSISINTLSTGTGAVITSTGTITVNQFANSNTLLTLLATVNVADSVILSSGVLTLGVGGIANLGNNVTLVMAGGSFSPGTGTLNLGGAYNIYYTGSVSGIGLEASLTGLQNITVNLSSASSQISMAGNLTVAGGVFVQRGSLNLNGYTLTVNGAMVASGSGSVWGTSSSNLVLNGSGSLDTLNFAYAYQSIGNLTVNVGNSGSVALASALTVSGALALNGGSFTLNGNTLAINGTVSATGSGAIVANGSSGITVNGTGNVGTLTFGGSGNTIGNLTVNIASGGTVTLGSGLTVSGTLSLTGGSLSLNGQNLTVSGTIAASGTGSINGTVSSNITLNGVGNVGTVAFIAGGQAINNLTLNIGSSGNVTLASSLTVGGMLTLTSGTITIDTGNLAIGASGSISGGSATSYVITTGTGSLIMTLANAGTTGSFAVGTQANFAPVVVTNNSGTSGSFSVNAQPIVYTNGTSGANLATTQSVVNTSWNVESSITSGANVNLQMTWNSSMQVNGFDHTQAYISHYINGAWNTQTPTSATADGNGNYSLSLTGVTSFSPFAVFDKNTMTAISEVKPSVTMQVYPNPSWDVINVALPSALPYYHLTVYDALGNTVITREGQNGITTFDVSNFAPGVYFLSLNNSITKRFVKQ